MVEAAVAREPILSLASPYCSASNWLQRYRQLDPTDFLQDGIGFCRPDEEIPILGVGGDRFLTGSGASGDAGIGDATVRSWCHGARVPPCSTRRHDPYEAGVETGFYQENL